MIVDFLLQRGHARLHVLGKGRGREQDQYQQFPHGMDPTCSRIRVCGR